MHCINYVFMYTSCLAHQASLEADKALDDLSQANEMLRVDIEKWGGSKDREVATLMKNVANDHIDYHQKVSIFHVHVYTHIYIIQIVHSLLHVYSTVHL